MNRRSVQFSTQGRRFFSITMESPFSVSLKTYLDSNLMCLAQKPNPNTKLCNYSTARLSQQYSSRGGPARCYGLFATRQNKVGTYLKDDKAGHLIAWIENIHKDVDEWELSESKIDFGCHNTTVRFAASQGMGTILIADRSLEGIFSTFLIFFQPL